VPPKSRPQRKTGFRGSLLAVPEPLPDDESDDEVISTDPAPAPGQMPTRQLEPEPTSEPDRVSAAPEPQLPGGPTSIEDDSEPPLEQPESTPAKDKRPPGTLRLNDLAAPQLWDAYLEDKTADPFLSYRQFASRIVLDGLAVRSRRQSRS